MREREEERRAHSTNHTNPSIPKTAQRSREKKAILNRLKAALAHLSLLSINVLVLGPSSLLLLDSTNINNKSINKDHAQVTLTGDVNNHHSTANLLEQKYIEVLEASVQDKEKLVESLTLLVEVQQKQIALLEEKTKKLEEEVITNNKTPE